MIGTPEQLAQWLWNQDRDRLFEVKEKRPRRSHTQNAYYWSLVNQLAAVMGVSDRQCHKWMLASYGVTERLYIRADVPLAQYFEYYDVKNRTTIDGASYYEIAVYKGSSKMDSKEFSRLINGIREECEAQGIPVLTPSEIAEMRYIEGEKDGD